MRNCARVVFHYVHLRNHSLLPEIEGLVYPSSHKNMTVTDDDVIYGGEVVTLAKEVIVDTEDMTGKKQARGQAQWLS